MDYILLALVAAVVVMGLVIERALLKIVGLLHEHLTIERKREAREPKVTL